MQIYKNALNILIKRIKPKMYKIRVKITGLYCAECIEQITRILYKHFEIKGIKLDIVKQVMVISSKKNIGGGDIVREIEQRGYGPVVILDHPSNR